MDKRKWVQTKKTLLYTSIGATATSILLKNAFRLDGNQLVMADDFGELGFMTIEPGGLKEEIISFTGISYNVSGTICTLSGVTRGLKGEDSYGTGGVAYGHSANRIAIFTNNPQHYAGFANKYNEETIENVWTFPSVAGSTRPKLDADTDAVLPTELITRGELYRTLSATTLLPTVDATSSATTGLVPAATLTWAHTIAGTNGYLVVAVTSRNADTVSTVTFNGDALTQLVTETRVTGDLRTELWARVAPDLGTHNIVVTMSGVTDITGNAISLNDVNQATPLDSTSAGANGSSTAPTTAITTLNTNVLIIDIVGTGTNPQDFTATVPGAIQTSIDSAANRTTAMSIQAAATVGAYNPAYTLGTSGNWVMQAIAIRGIANPGGGGGSGNGTALAITVTQTAHGLIAGNVIQSNGVANQFTTAQADNANDSEAIGIVTAVIDANNFTYVSSAIQLSGAYVPVGTPGDAVFLDPSVAGGMTTTKPTAVGHVVRALGTIIASGATMYFDIAALAEEITSSSSGNSAEKKLGVGDFTDTDWVNYYFPFNMWDDGTATTAIIWDFSSGFQGNPTAEPFVAGSRFEVSSTLSNGFLPYFAGATDLAYKFNTAKQAIVSIAVFTAPVTANSQGGIGFSVIGGVNCADLPGADEIAVAFIRNAAGAWFTYSGDGSNSTSKAVTISANASHVFRIEYDPANATPQARFYVDGVLLQTHVTADDLPLAVASNVGFSGGNNAGDSAIEAVMPPYFAVER